MSCVKDIKADLSFLKNKYKVSKVVGILTNRGVHSLMCYRISHSLYIRRVPLLPLILTRIIQILYGIDIDYKAKLEGGIIIIHGVGLVIGEGAIIRNGTIIYHQVTLGIKGFGETDGFPVIEEDCELGAGAKLFGAISIGRKSVIGANVVVTSDIEEYSLVKMNSYIVKKINSH